MAHADSTTYFNTGDSSIIGCFEEKEHGNLFEFSKVPEDKIFTIAFPEYDSFVWVGPSLVAGTEKRYAKVLKTVAYVVVDEDENGPVVEKWAIKNRRVYDRPIGV